jgi:Tol biopolymer transport system component
MDAEDARPLPGTEDATAEDPPIWSPDSRYLAFASAGKLKKIEAAGGPAQTLCDAPLVLGGAWTPDNKILFGTLGPLQIVSAEGGTPTPLTVLNKSRNELAHELPTMLPDGHHFVYLRLSVPFENGGVYIGSLDSKPEQQSTKKLLPDTTGVVYVPSPGDRNAPGFLLFARGATMTSNAGTLMAQPFDPKRMEFKGPPGSSEAVSIADQVRGFSASATGVLAFSTSTQGARQLTWVDRKGAVLATVGEPGEYNGLTLSPDGTRVAYLRGPDLWLFELARGVPTRFTFGNLSQYAWWSADGNRILFLSVRGSGWGIYQKAANLAGPEELLFQSADPKRNPNWTHDGKFLIYDVLSSDGKGFDMWVLPTAGSAADRKPVPFLRTQFNEGNGFFSPDGRWVAYESDQSGKSEIYVLPFDETNPGSPPGSLHQVSKDGGTETLWRGDGRELFYHAPDGYLMSVDVNVTGRTFQSGAPQRLFKMAPGTAWSLAADGKRFLLALPVSASSGAPASQPYHVVVNWTALLKR